MVKIWVESFWIIFFYFKCLKCFIKVFLVVNKIFIVSCWDIGKDIEFIVLLCKYILFYILVYISSVRFKI